MASAGTVVVDFAAETAKFTAEMKKVNDRLKNVEGGFKSMERVAKAAFKVFSVGVVVNFAKQAAAAADALGKTADKIGTSTESLKAFQIAAGEAGVGLSQANKLLVEAQTRLGQAAAGAGEAAKFIQALGLNVADLQKLAPDQLFQAYADSINKLSNRSEQLATANALMGESAREAFTLIQAGSPALDSAREFTERFGLALDRVSTKQIEAANDAIGRVATVSQTASQRIVAGLAPAVEFFANQILDATGNTEGLQRVMEGFSAVAITAFEIVANAARSLQAAFFGIAAAGARVLQALTFGDVSLAFAASVDANLAKANEALEKIKSIEQIQQTVVQALEQSRANAAASVAAQGAAVQGAGLTLGGEQIGLTDQQRFEEATIAAQAFAEAQAEIERGITAVTQEQLAERVYATNAANDAMVRRAQQAAETEIALRQQAADAGVGAMRLLATNSKTFAKISKALDIASAIRNTYVAVTNQLKSGDPYTAAARAVAVGAFGAAQIAAIARTPDEASFGTVTTISGGGSALNPAFVATPATGGADQQFGAQSVSTVQVIIQGNMVGNREFLDEMIDEIKEAVTDRDVILIHPTSRNALDLVPA